MENKISNHKPACRSGRSEIRKPACPSGLSRVDDRQVGLQSRGFTIVELLVVVAIVAVLSVSSVVGFGHLGDVLKIREISGIVTDSMKHEELKILRGDLEKVTIYFLRDYLVIDEESSDVELLLSFDAMSCAGGYQIEYTGVSSVSLNKTDEEGRSVEVKTMNQNDTDCIDFKGVAEREWNFQLTDNELASNKVRFIHFNANREKLENSAFIDTGVGLKVELKAPYAKRYFYNSLGELVDSSHNDYPLSLTVKNDSDANPETITLQ